MIETVSNEEDSDDKDFDLPKELKEHPESEIEIPDRDEQGT